MRLKLLLIGLFIAGAVQAGPVQLEPKEIAPAPPSITSDDHWYFNIGSPGWIAFVSGDIGLHGVTTSTNVDFSQILTHLTGIASVSADLRKGRFGVYGDFLYLSASDGIYNDGLIKKANLTYNQYIVDGEVYYRVLQCPAGWLDLRAGGRYTNSFTRMELTAAPAKVDMASAAFVTAANEDLRGLLEHLINGGLNPGNPALPFPPIGEDVKRKVIQLIRHARQDPATAQQKISRILKNHFNRGYGLTEYWGDPYIGVGGRYRLSKPFYVTGKVDVGGFTVGSDVTIQATTALGCNFTRNIYAELGFRYLYYDYENESDGYIYRVSTYGPQLTLGVEF